MDFDIRKATKQGLSFRKVFIELLVIAVGLFLANRWNTTMTEIIVTYFPAGEKLFEKIIFNGIITFVLVGIVFFILKWDKGIGKKGII